MSMNKARDIAASIFALCLIVVLIAGVMAAMGKPIPIIGKFFGQ